MAYKRFHATPAIQNRVHRDQDQIGERLLHRLGVFDDGEPIATKEGDAVRPTAEKTLPARPLSCAAPYTEPLKKASSDSDLAFAAKKATRVQFQTTVSVVEIPSHQDCDQETRQSIWTGGKELRSNAERNRIEFSADGECWRDAVEEDGMYMYDGELVHPATYWLKVQELRESQKMSRFQEAFSSFFALPIIPVQNRSSLMMHSSPPLATARTLKRTQSTMTSLMRLADNN